MKQYRLVDEYLTNFTGDVREKLDELRALILATAPGAEECISYGMPAYKMNGPLVYFAGYKSHIGFYPTSTPIKALAKDLTKYKTSKGAIQFSLDEKIPKGLIQKIVRFKIKENKAKK